MISCLVEGGKAGVQSGAGVTGQCPDAEILFVPHGGGGAGLRLLPRGAHRRGWAGWVGAQEMEGGGGGNQTDRPAGRSPSGHSLESDGPKAPGSCSFSLPGQGHWL